MGTTVVAVLVLLAVAAAESERKTPKFNQEQLTRQKDIIRLLTRYRQPLLWEDLAAIVKDHKLQPENYQVPQLVEDFVQIERDGELLASDQPISVLDDSHVDHIKLFFNLLYHAKDYDTFYKTALYLRERLNKVQFVVSFLICVKMRKDTKDFILPRIYEIFPEFFVKSDVIQKVYDNWMQGLKPLPPGVYYIMGNCTEYSPVHTPEERLSYFTEDVGLNDYFADFNYRYPYFLSASNYSIANGEVRGDVFYHTLRNLYARYFLERLSNGLPDVTPLNYDKGVTTGYNPHLRLLNGDAFNPRPENQNLLDVDASDLERIRKSEYRLSEMIDMGYVISAMDGRMRYKQSEATNLLGNLIQNNADSIHPRYYGALYRDLLSLVGRYDPTQRYGLAASVLGKYETMLRDPAYFQIVKRILNILQLYQNNLEPYTKEELKFPGLKVEFVDTHRLATFFEDFRIGVDNSLKASSPEEVKKFKLVVEGRRLNRRAFAYRIKVSSEEPAKAIFRAFYGPRYDSYGNEMTLDEARQYFVEFDRFVYELVAGENWISRSFGVYYPMGMADLEESLNLALQGRYEFPMPSEYTRVIFPDRLVLPRGTAGGLPLRFYVIASPLPQGVPAAEATSPQEPLACDWFTELADGRPVAFPLDRRIPHPRTFLVPNSFLEDIVVYHTDTEE